MKPKKIHLFLIIVPTLMGIFILLIISNRSPKTPQELYKNKCSHCHDLPDLSGYQREEIEPLVYFMRHHNGAKRVISDEESIIIIHYLKNK